MCSKYGLRILLNILGTVVKAANLNNAGSLQRSQFPFLLEIIESQFTSVLTFNNVQKFICGQVLHRFELQKLAFFFKKKTYILPKYPLLNG